jgi:hypothetical protein
LPHPLVAQRDRRKHSSDCFPAARGAHPKARYLDDTAPCPLPSVRTPALHSRLRHQAGLTLLSAASLMSRASGCQSAAALRRSSASSQRNDPMTSIPFLNNAALHSSSSSFFQRVSGIHVWRRLVIYPLIASFYVLMIIKSLCVFLRSLMSAVFAPTPGRCNTGAAFLILMP